MTSPQRHKRQHKPIKNMKEIWHHQNNAILLQQLTPSKWRSATKLKIMIWKKPSDIWENTDKSMNPGIVHEENEEFNKQKSFKNQEILENKIHKMKNVTASTCRLRRVCGLQDRSLGIIQSEKNKEIKIKKKQVYMNCGTWSKERISIYWESQKKRRRKMHKIYLKI